MREILLCSFSIESRTIEFDYVNYKLEKERRKVKPIEIWFGSSKYHTGQQWFIRAHCYARNQERSFAMRDMLNVKVFA